MLKMPDGSSTIIIQGKRLQLKKKFLVIHINSQNKEFDEKRLKNISKESVALFDTLKDMS